MKHLRHITKHYSGECEIDGQGSMTVSCVHCQYTWIYKPGSGKKRGWCYNCNGFICGPKCIECIPYEKKLE